MQCRILIIVALCSWCGQAHADPRTLTLRQAVALATRQNPALAAAGAALSGAAGNVLSARGLDDLIVSARGEYRLLRRFRALDDPLAEPASDQFSGSLRLTQPLPIGGRVTLGLETSYARSQGVTDRAPPSAFERWSPALQLRLEQPLLRGFGVGVARAERRHASVARDLASIEREGIATSLLADVVSGYWRLAHALRELDIRRDSALAARQQLERVRANIAVGKLPPNASAEIEVAIALRADAVLLAEQALTEQALVLGRLCGMPHGEHLRPAEPLPPIDWAAPTERGLGETVAVALAQNPQLQAVRARARGATVELDVSENGLLPQLDLSLAGGPVGSAPEAGAAYDELTRFGSYALLAELSLELPLARRAARGKRDYARARLQQALLDEAGVADQIRVAVTSAVLALTTTRKRAAALVPSQRAAALDLEAAKARFEVGRASTFDVLRRQDALAAVQLLLLGAELAALETEAALDALTGEIFEHHGVVLGAGEP